jgi:hypothetical protein
MRKLMMLSLLVLGASVAGLFSPSPAAAAPPGGTCVTYCSVPNACGYVCCFQQCCGSRCIDLDCAPPPPCGGDN